MSWAGSKGCSKSRSAACTPPPSSKCNESRLAVFFQRGEEGRCNWQSCGYMAHSSKDRLELLEGCPVFLSIECCDRWLQSPGLCAISGELCRPGHHIQSLRVLCWAPSKHHRHPISFGKWGLCHPGVPIGSARGKGHEWCAGRAAQPVYLRAVPVRFSTAAST
jgi:hypothetical protein